MIKVMAGMIIAASLCAAVDKDMQRAIAWERQKDRAAARQAQIEKRHPTVTNNNANNANRSSEENSQGQKVKDPGPKK